MINQRNFKAGSRKSTDICSHMNANKKKKKWFCFQHIRSDNEIQKNENWSSTCFMIKVYIYWIIHITNIFETLTQSKKTIVNIYATFTNTVLKVTICMMNSQHLNRCITNLMNITYISNNENNIKASTDHTH